MMITTIVNKFYNENVIDDKNCYYSQKLPNILVPNKMEIIGKIANFKTVFVSKFLSS